MSSVLFDGRAPRLWLRLEQDADKPYYARTPRSLADGYIVNANLVEHSPTAVASFLDTLEKPFIVDPMSYRFERLAWHTKDRDGQSTNKRNYSRVWKKYSANVGGLSGDPLADRGMSGIAGEEALLRFCQNVIEFQEHRLRHEWLEDGFRYVGMDRLLGSQLAPAAYIAPYLVVGEHDIASDIQAATLLAKATASLASLPVLAVLPILPEALGSVESIRLLAAGIGQSGVAGALLWTVGLSAYDLVESPELFTGLVVLIRGLADAGLEVGMLYGGFLSGLLRGFGLGGFSHALLYGEQRGLEPTGGRPPTRFYLPPIKTTVPYTVAEELVARMSPADYLTRVCACEICRSLVESPRGGGIRAYFETYLPDGGKRPFPTQTSLDLNRVHFLYARADELAFARARAEPALITDLLGGVAQYPPRVSQTLRAWALRLRTA